MSDSTSRSQDEVDTLLTTLADQQRRHILYHLQARSTEVAALDDIVAVCQEKTQRNKSESQIRLHLQHSALPRLADADLIEYDARSETLRYRGHPLVDDVLKKVADQEDLPV